MSILYRLLTHALAPFWLTYLFIRHRKQARLSERLGFYPERDDFPVWIQGVSVGEVKLALKLASALNDRSIPTVISSTTATGLDLAIREAKQSPDPLAFTLDIGSCASRALKRLRPRALVMVETELWPVLFKKAKQAGIPVYIINARISDRSLKKVKRLRNLYRTTLEGVRVAAQNKEHVSRFLDLGARPTQTVVLGNLKYDLSPPESHENITSALQGYCSGSPLWTAGSVREGEERKVIRAHLSVIENIPEARLIIAPRHIERSSLCLSICKKEGLQAILRSNGSGKDWNVMILDTIGELWSAYALCNVAFVGGSLVPLGGQNIIEPAFLRKPVLFGPSIENFRAESERLLAAGGANIVKDENELASKVCELLSDSEKAEDIGLKSEKAASRNRGALERTVSWIQDTI